MPSLHTQLYRKRGTPDGITRGAMLERSLGAAAALLVAGEYTSYAFMGYMEGALNSGAAVARRIAVKDGVLKGAPA